VPHPLLIDSFRTVPAFQALAVACRGRGGSALASGLAGSAPLVLVSALHRARPERIWTLVAPGPEAAEQATADLEALLGEGAVFLYPQRESLPYEEGEPHLEIGGTRVEALEALLSGRASLLVTTPRALQELAPAVEGLDDLRLEIRTGEDELLPALASRPGGAGLRAGPRGGRSGQFALRGASSTSSLRPRP
jgi:transcription-repair coupling factor (superfamily II helicase)